MQSSGEPQPDELGIAHFDDKKFPDTGPSNELKTDHLEKDNRSYFKRKPLLSLLLLLLGFIVVALAIVVPVVIVLQNQKAKESKSKDWQPTIITPASPDYHDPFDDTARPNNFTPPLNEKFRYNSGDKIRGINLGGWLVLEPFITPKIFEQAVSNNNTPIVDEWSLCEALGPDEAKRQLKNHYETFINETDFKKIAEMGFNHVRIPLGHWALRAIDGEPFVAYTSWQYLIRGIQWARKYGLRVMVELHTAPGSQNGWNHSGRQGPVGFLNGTEGQNNADLTQKIAAEIAHFFDKPEWSNVVTLFGVLNEPAMMKIPPKTVKRWYDTTYNLLRKVLGADNGPYLLYHDGFLPMNQWYNFFGKQYQRVMLETHLYMIFNNGLVSMPRDMQAEFPCTAWKKDITQAVNLTGPIMVGEFSVATNDCAKYLNGVGLGARYDGTLPQDGMPAVPVCPTCTCQGVDDWRTWTDEYKLFLAKFLERQMESYEASVGWFFWTYKTQDHVNPHWDYLLAWELGFAPRDINNRTYHCSI